MNLKKLFAAVAGVSLLANTLLPAGALGATSYGAELESAYAYAYGVGATTQYPIENANMYGAITRAELAKVVSNWAEKVLKIEADASITPTFSDINSLRTSDLYAAVIKATQMGLMGQGITAFRPYDTVTRAEFGTILSRALWGNTNEGGTPYYAAHLNALKNEGIMTMINDPMMKEIRGYVMIMLQRVDEVYLGSVKDKPAECKDPMVILICAVDPTSSECPAACRDGGTTTDPTDPTVKAGDLDVSVADYSATVKSAPKQGTVIFNAVQFKSSEAVTMNSITVAQAGLTSRNSVNQVWFERDGVAVTSKARPTTDGTAVLNFKAGLAVKANEKLDLVVALTGTAGAEVSFKIAAVDSSARNVSLTNALTTTYRTTEYKVAEIDLSVDGNKTATATQADTTYKLGSQTTYTIGKFNIQNNGASNEDRIVNIKSVLLKNAQSTDLSFLKNIQVLRDGVNVAKNIVIEGRNLTITLNDTLNAGKRGVYTIVAEIGNMVDVPSHVQLQLANLTDVVADEVATNFRTTNIVTTPAGSPKSLYLNYYVFNGGRVTFANDAAFPTVVEAASGAIDVTIASGTLTLTEPVSLPSLMLLTTTAGGVRSMALEVNGVRYTATDAPSGTGTSFTWDEIYVNKAGVFSVKLLASISNSASTEITFALPNNAIAKDAFTGKPTYLNTDTNSTDDIAGRIQIARIRVQTPTFSLNNGLSSTQNIVVGETATRTIFEGPISSSKGNITVDSIDFAISAANSTGTFSGQDIDLDILVDGNIVDSKTLKLTAPNATSVSFNTNIALGSTSKTIKINASLASNGTGRFVGTVTANGTDSNGNKTQSSSINTVALRVLSEAGISVTNAGTTSSVVIEGANAQLTRFTASVQDGTVNLESLTVTGTNFPANTVATLNIGGSTFQSTATNSTTGIVFNNINLSMTEKDYDIRITTNINTDGETIGRELKVDKVVMAYAGKTATGTINATYYFVKAFPMVTVVSTATKNQITLRITNGNDAPITLSGLLLSGTSATIDGQNVGTIENGTAGDWTTLSTPKSLARGESVELVIRAETLGTIGQLYGINYTMTTAGEPYDYKVTDKYTNIGKWGDFRVSYSS